MLNELAKEIHRTAVEHGWWDDNRTFGDIIALCHSELSEALEEYRDGKPMAYFVRDHSVFPQYANDYADETDFTEYNGEKPEGIAVEMADCIIRILDWCGKENIDIDQIIRIKHEYNKRRPYKHGGKIL